MDTSTNKNTSDNKNYIAKFCPFRDNLVVKMFVDQLGEVYGDC